MVLSSTCNFRLALNSMHKAKCTLSPSKQSFEILLSWRHSRQAISAHYWELSSVIKGQKEGKHIPALLTNNFHVPVSNMGPSPFISFLSQAQSFTFQKISLSVA